MTAAGKRKPIAWKRLRWVLVNQFDWGKSFLGKYCYYDLFDHEPDIRTFETRAEAREAIKTSLNSYRETARVVRCEVIVREVIRKAVK